MDTNKRQMQLQEIQNLKLSVECELPRLRSSFGGNYNVVLQQAESKNPGAHKLITTHYSSLSFQSKPVKYWEQQFVLDYANFMMLTGIRAGTIDDFIFDDVKSCCAIDLAIHNEESIKAAIKMNLAGKFAKVYEPYEQINRKFLMEIMTAYDSELKKAHKLAIKLRDEMNKPKPPTPEEIEQKTKDGIIESFLMYKRLNDLNIISHVEYDYLERHGITLVSKERKVQLMVEAKAHLTVVYGQGSIAKGFEEVKRELAEGIRYNEIVAMAKKLAVRDYYATIETLKI